MENAPKVSVITPTFERSAFHSQIHRCFAAQDYPDLEWLILDDSSTPSNVFAEIRDPRISYEYLNKKISIGEKRNRLARAAQGEIIVHFDDDDFYAADYVSALVRAMREKEADLLNLRGWFLYDLRHDFFGYWDLGIKEGLHYVCDAQSIRPTIFSTDNNSGLANNHLGFGFGWAYKKSVWRASPFPDINWNEDGEFALNALKKFRLDGTHDRQGRCLHMLHPGNTSRCFPQYQLPNFMMAKFFPGLKF